MSEITKGTRVDLGDDLLNTRTIPYDRNAEKTPERAEGAPPVEAPSAPESIEELLLNAKILLSEGLLEDAKKTLRRVLRVDPPNLSARDRLEEIQKIEIKRLLGQDDGNTGGGFLRAKKKKVEPALEDGESVAAALERELGGVMTPEERFFPTEAEREEFAGNLEALCVGVSGQDRIDLGIGFLEMEFYEIAIRMFRAAAAAEPDERRARALLATAWIARGNGFEAMTEIESLIADQSAPGEERIDYGYMAGRAQELLGNFEMAVRWYRAVIQLEPGYRDAEDRLRRATKMITVRRGEGPPR
jgi:tetratricopeptide (TPR) repeat protein